MVPPVHRNLPDNREFLFEVKLFLCTLNIFQSRGSCWERIQLNAYAAYFMFCTTFSLNFLFPPLAILSTPSFLSCFSLSISEQYTSTRFIQDIGKKGSWRGSWGVSGWGHGGCLSDVVEDSYELSVPSRGRPSSNYPPSTITRRNTPALQRTQVRYHSGTFEQGRSNLFKYSSARLFSRVWLNYFYWNSNCNCYGCSKVRAAKKRDNFIPLFHPMSCSIVFSGS